MVRIEFEESNKNGWQSQNAIGIIPEKYRPNSPRYIGGSIYVANQHNYCAFEIRADGSIIQRFTTGTFTQARCFGCYNI